MEPHLRLRSTRPLLAALLISTALAAFGGGFFGLSGARGVPTAWLQGSPFSDYTTPSLLLLVVVGGSQFFAGMAVALRWPVARVAAVAASAILLAWMGVEYVVIGQVSWLQPVTLLVGVLVLPLAAALPAPAASRLTELGA